MTSPFFHDVTFFSIIILKANDLISLGGIFFKWDLPPDSGLATALLSVLILEVKVST